MPPIALPPFDAAPAAPRQPVIGSLARPCALEPGAIVGKAYDPAQAAALAGQSGLRSVRVLRPGTMTTQEFLQDRLTVIVDDSGKVIRAYCG